MKDEGKARKTYKKCKLAVKLEIERKKNMATKIEKNKNCRSKTGH
jgi:hypothetical protein